MSFPTYPKYKDSGVEWLGEVPEHWAVRRVGSLFRQVDEPGEDGVPILSVSIHDGVSNKELDEKETDRKVLRSDDREKYKKVQPGDLVYNMMRAWQGGFGCVAVPGMVSPAYVVARPLSKFSTSFVEQLLRTPQAIEQMRRYSQGVTDFRLRLYWEEFKIIVVVLPSPCEQTAIAAFLDHETAKIDALVAEQQRLIELLKEKRQAVISHTVTKGLNPHAPMKASGIEWLGEVPETWTVKKLGRAVFMQEGPGLRTWQFTDEGTRVICVTNITEGGIDFSRLEKFISTKEYNSGYRHFTVRPGDVLLSSSGNSWGKVSIYDSEEEVILNTSTIRLNELEGTPLSRDYIAMLLRSDTVREQLGLAMTGSCQPNFGPSHLNSVMVAIPVRGEQHAMVEYLKIEIAKLDTLTAEAQRAIELLQEHRTALISAAVTGKIDVRGAVTS